jgi:REP element-mobilizing transposase RayT
MEPHLSAPLAHFITFHTYGTWLPGDSRGSVDAHHRVVGTPCVGRSDGRNAASARRLAHPPVELRPEERTVVLRTMQEVCRHRGWVLHAANIRVNHVHVVVQAELVSPERVMNDLEAWATRRVVEAGLRPRGTPMWVRHGSTRQLWRPEAVIAALVYVVERQGGGMQWAFG